MSATTAALRKLIRDRIKDFSPIITDNFDRADGALGSDWVEQIQAPAISGGLAIPTGAGGTFSLAYRAGAWNADHSSQVRVAAIPGSNIWIGVRMSGTGAAHGYFWAVQTNGVWNLWRYVSGTAVGLTFGSMTALSIGDVLNISIAGTEITVRHNGAIVTTITDSVLTSGSPGFGFFVQESQDQAAELWHGSGLANSSVGAAIGNRLYWNQAPDDVFSAGLYPFGVMRLDSFGQPGQDSDVRRLEVQLVHYPRSNQPALEGIVDVVEQALLRWLRSNTTDGIIHVFALPSRLTLPPSAEPGEQELVQIILTAELSVWPTYRTRYAATA